MVKFYCIADEDTVRGFRLAGVEGRAVTSTPQAEEAFDHAASIPGCAIVIVTQSIAANIRDQVDAFRLAHDRPLVVEIPGPEGPVPSRKTLDRLVSSAIGMNVGRREEI